MMMLFIFYWRSIFIFHLFNEKFLLLLPSLSARFWNQDLDFRRTLLTTASPKMWETEKLHRQVKHVTPSVQALISWWPYDPGGGGEVGRFIKDATSKIRKSGNGVGPIRGEQSRPEEPMTCENTTYQ
jgi:hypothetical protein